MGPISRDLPSSPICESVLQTAVRGSVSACQPAADQHAVHVHTVGASSVPALAGLTFSHLPF